MKGFNIGGVAALSNSAITLLTLIGVGSLDPEIGYTSVVLQFSLALLAFSFLSLGHEAGLINSGTIAGDLGKGRVINVVVFTCLMLVAALSVTLLKHVSYEYFLIFSYVFSAGLLRMLGLLLVKEGRQYADFKIRIAVDAASLALLCLCVFFNFSMVSFLLMGTLVRVFGMAFIWCVGYSAPVRIKRRFVVRELICKSNYLIKEDFYYYAISIFTIAGAYLESMLYLAVDDVHHSGLAAYALVVRIFSGLSMYWSGVFRNQQYKLADLAEKDTLGYFSSIVQFNEKNIRTNLAVSIIVPLMLYVLYQFSVYIESIENSEVYKLFASEGFDVVLFSAVPILFFRGQVGIPSAVNLLLPKHHRLLLCVFFTSINMLAAWFLFNAYGLLGVGVATLVSYLVYNGMIIFLFRSNYPSQSATFVTRLMFYAAVFLLVYFSVFCVLRFFSILNF